MEVLQVVLDDYLADAFIAVAEGQWQSVLVLVAAANVLDLEVD
jgi:hypothetical protein